MPTKNVAPSFFPLWHLMTGKSQTTEPWLRAGQDSFWACASVSTWLAPAGVYCSSLFQPSHWGLFAAACGFFHVPPVTGHLQSRPLISELNPSGELVLLGSPRPPGAQVVPLSQVSGDKQALSDPHPPGLSSALPSKPLTALHLAGTQAPPRGSSTGSKSGNLGSQHLPASLAGTLKGWDSGRCLLSSTFSSLPPLLSLTNFWFKSRLLGTPCPSSSLFPP